MRLSVFLHGCTKGKCQNGLARQPIPPSLASLHTRSIFCAVTGQRWPGRDKLFKRKPVFQYSEHKRNPRDVDSVRFPLLFFFFLFFSSFFHFGTTITNRIFWRVLDDDIPRQSMKMSRLRIIYTWTYVTCMCAFFFIIVFVFSCCFPISAAFLWSLLSSLLNGLLYLSDLWRSNKSRLANQTLS